MMSAVLRPLARPLMLLVAMDVLLGSGRSGEAHGGRSPGERVAPPGEVVRRWVSQRPTHRRDQRSRERTPCGAWLACASIAVPACDRICERVKLTISEAMSVSRMRLSDADRFSTATLTVVDGVLEPVLHRTEVGARGDTVLMALSIDGRSPAGAARPVEAGLSQVDLGGGAGDRRPS